MPAPALRRDRAFARHLPGAFHPDGRDWLAARPALLGARLRDGGARAVVEDGFFRRDLAEIVAFAALDNQRSRAVMARLGMTYDPAEDFDLPVFPEGHPLRRSALYRVRRPEKLGS